MSYLIPIDREEQMVLVLALYILRDLDPKPPKKKQVLRFIKARELIRFYDDDLLIRENGEWKWENDLAWAREDIKNRGFLIMPEVGIWKLTEKGGDWIKERAKSWLQTYEQDPPSKERFLERCHRVNDCFFAHMIILGRGGDLKKRPNQPPEPTH